MKKCVWLAMVVLAASTPAWGYDLGVGYAGAWPGSYVSSGTTLGAGSGLFSLLANSWLSGCTCGYSASGYSCTCDWDFDCGPGPDCGPAPDCGCGSGCGCNCGCGCSSGCGCDCGGSTGAQPSIFELFLMTWRSQN